MFLNYLKLAIKVLGRRTFFTVISLFGISFTLMILILLSAYLDAELGNHQPFSKKDNMVFLDRVISKLIVPDTTWEVDTLQMDGIEVLDSSMIVGESTSSMSISSLGFYLADHYLRDVTGAENYSFYSPQSTYDLFVRGRKLTFDAIFTDAAYWDVYDFVFKYGRPFARQEIEQQNQLAILSTRAARDYFGSESEALGEFIELDGKQFEVIGIVNQTANSKAYVSADVYLPLTSMNPRVFESNDFHGPLEAVFLAGSSRGKSDILRSLEQKSEQIPLPNPESYNTLILRGTDFFGRYAYSILPVDNDPIKSKKQFLLLGGSLLILFILLPTLNLINLNVSRVMDRSAEIGVRKAFGAHSGTVLLQLVFENIVLTFLGGIIGFVFAYILLFVLNDSQILGETVLRFNYRIFFYSLLICLGFGIISGYLPANRMSKIHIANAIKQTNV